MAGDDVAHVVLTISPLIDSHGFDTIERLLRDAMRDHRDNPYLNLLLGTVLIRSDLERAATYLLRARQLAPNDDYVLDRVTGATWWMGDRFALQRMRDVIPRVRSGEADAARPPSTWPRDVARDLRRALLSEQATQERLGRVLSQVLADDDGSIDVMLDYFAESDHPELWELREARSQLRAMKRRAP